MSSTFAPMFQHSCLQGSSTNRYLNSESCWNKTVPRGTPPPPPKTITSSGFNTASSTFTLFTNNPLVLPKSTICHWLSPFSRCQLKYTEQTRIKHKHSRTHTVADTQKQTQCRHRRRYKHKQIRYRHRERFQKESKETFLRRTAWLRDIIRGYLTEFRILEKQFNLTHQHSNKHEHDLPNHPW